VEQRAPLNGSVVGFIISFIIGGNSKTRGGQSKAPTKAAPVDEATGAALGDYSS
jgi:hypothetical protein